MKQFLLSMAVAAASSALAAAQRLSETCTADSCREGVGTCEQYNILSSEGRQCESGNVLLATDTSLSSCVDLVISTASCSNVFMYSPSTVEYDSVCECHESSDASATCIVVDAHNRARERVYEVTEDEPFCSCPSDVAADAEITHTGMRCEQNITTNIQFNNKVNILNNVINSGQVHAEMISVPSASSVRTYINDVTLHRAAVELERGFDGEVSLDIFVYREAFTGSLRITNFSNVSQIERIEESDAGSAYVAAAEDALIVALIKNGYSTSLQNFASLSDPTVSTGPCHCPAVGEAAFNCSQDCVIFTTEFVVLEVRQFFEWELALIILACVLFVCILAIGLSFVYRKPTEVVITTKKVGDKEQDGVEMGAF